MKSTLNDIGKLLRENASGSDKHYYGIVTSINTDLNGHVTSYNVALGEGGDEVKCAKLAGAKEGDTVMVTLMENGYAVVTGTVGGDTDAADAADAADAVATDLASNYSNTEEVKEMIEEAGGSDTYEVTEWASGSSVSATGTWSTIMPSLTSGQYLWMRVVRYNSDGSQISVVQSPQLVSVMNGLFAFMNAVTNAGHTTISGSAIESGTIKLGGYANGNGQLEIRNATNDVIGTFNNLGIALNASSNDYATLSTLYKVSSSTWYKTELSASGITHTLSWNGTQSQSKYGQSATIHDALTVGGLTTISNLMATGMGSSSNYSGNVCLLNGSNYLVTNSNVSIGSGGSISCGAVTSSGAIKGTKLTGTSPSTASSSVANARISTASGTYGEVMLTGSSQYLKHDIKDAEFDCERLYDLHPRQFIWNDDVDENITLGLIADEVAEIFPVAAMYRDTYRGGKDASDWDERIIVPAMLKLIQMQHIEIEGIKEKLYERETN